jgi:hypothetical protein
MKCCHEIQECNYDCSRQQIRQFKSDKVSLKYLCYVDLIKKVGALEQVRTNMCQKFHVIFRSTQKNVVSTSKTKKCLE